MRNSALNPESIRGYHEQGYLIVPSGLSAQQAQSLASEVLRILEEDASARSDDPGYRRSNRYLRFSVALHLRSPGIRDYVLSGVFRAIGDAFIGEDAELQFTSTITKSPGKNQQVEWHQDAIFERDGHQPRLICWTSLTDTHPENGGLSLVPGSHRQGLLPHVPSLINEFNQVAVGTDAASALPLSLRAGDILVIHPHLVHGSPENKTATDRVALMSGYQKPKPEYTEGELKSRMKLIGGKAGG
jgi:phytanoyl-CoA hydroxylase